MPISTMNDVPGQRVSRVPGEVFGRSVRSRNVGSQLGAGFASRVGGELEGMQASRLETPFETSETGGNRTEICAYGTAVVVDPA